MIKMENLKQVIDQLNATLASMQSQQNDLMAKLTNEQRALIAPIQSDITMALNALKNGDMTEINKLQSKYANINHK